MNLNTKSPIKKKKKQKQKATKTHNPSPYLTFKPLPITIMAKKIILLDFIV